MSSKVEMRFDYDVCKLHAEQKLKEWKEEKKRLYGAEDKSKPFESYCVAGVPCGNNRMKIPNPGIWNSELKTRPEVYVQGEDLVLPADWIVFRPIQDGGTYFYAKKLNPQTKQEEYALMLKREYVLNDEMKSMVWKTVVYP